MSFYDYTLTDKNKEYTKLINKSYRDASIEEAREVSKALKELTVHYDLGAPQVSDETWDDMYFWLQEWQKIHRGVIDDSCVDIVYFQEVSKLEKVEHNHPMLSLQKTKDLDEVKAFCGDKDCIAMLKMDGLTCSLYYENGMLVRAETRGNGYIGEDITHNAMVIPSIPKTINYLDPLVVDGEVICKYDDFEPFVTQYKNPRNFAAGSIRLLNSEESYNRHLTFVAWDAPKSMLENGEEIKTLSDKFYWLDRLGFMVVPYVVGFVLNDGIEYLKYRAEINKYPIDGLVFKYDDCAYYNSLGNTSHHFRGGLAFKFYDETYETQLQDIEWTMGRTGVLTPIAIFDEVDTGDSVVSRASLHNISVMYGLYRSDWHTGMRLEIYLANMIIPQVKSVKCAEMAGVKRLVPPTQCPVCGGETEVCQVNDSKELICANPLCEGKAINRLNYFCSKKGLDIKGLSKATLEKLMDWGWLSTFEDIFCLNLHRYEWSQKEGFGPKSVDNILAAIEKAKNTTLEAFIAAIGIPLIGRNVSKDLSQKLDSYESFRKMIDEKFDFSQFDGFAEAKTSALLDFDYTEADNVYPYLTIAAVKKDEGAKPLDGQTFVITGRVTKFKNRDELKTVIESNGGKVVGSISGNTSYLINNDINSTSAKNKAAKERGIPIITEDTLLSMI